ncbi:hypothetical protein MRX96_015820 [Rhipicephalus microplus]
MLRLKNGPRRRPGKDAGRRLLNNKTMTLHHHTGELRIGLLYRRKQNTHGGRDTKRDSKWKTGPSDECRSECACVNALDAAWTFQIAQQLDTARGQTASFTPALFLLSSPAHRPATTR